MIDRNLSALVAVGLLAGCTTDAEIANMTPRQRMAAAYDYCVKDVQTWNLTVKQEAMSFMRVSKQQLPHVFCTRLVNGFATGRVTMDDGEKVRRGQKTEVYKILKGQ